MANMFDDKGELLEYIFENYHRDGYLKGDEALAFLCQQLVNSNPSINLTAHELYEHVHKNFNIEIQKRSDAIEFN